MKLTKTERNKFKTDLRELDVVQIHPGVKKCGGCYMTVTELKVGGCLGYIMVPGIGVVHSKAPIRYDSLQRIGVAEWVENWGRPKK